jgi:amino acid transporter
MYLTTIMVVIMISGSGIALNLAGPKILRLGFQSFIVFVGGLLLFGAVNTAIIGANAVLNRISEDGVLVGWFRAPHKKYGTSYRLINLVVILQLLTILCSRGDVYVLGEAYAFGVVWSFAFKGLATWAGCLLPRVPPEIRRGHVG